MAAGVGILAGFFGWERRLARRPGGQPQLDMGLFTSASFTWGVILAAVAVLPLPLVGGLIAGAVPADRIGRARRRSRRRPCTAHARTQGDHVPIDTVIVHGQPRHLLTAARSATAT